MAITAGMYELRSMLQTSMVVTGQGFEPVTGSNVFLYSNNDSNNRKWNLSSNSRGWRFQNAANGLYGTLASATPANGVNVRQWTGSVNPIQYWNIIETGDTVTIDGYTCPVVKLGSYATTDGATWMLDVDGAMTSNNANMEINRANSNASQTFALFPTALLSNSFPVPARFGWSSSTNANPYYNQGGHTLTDMKLGWQMPSTWTPTSARGYERRIRSRYMDAVTSTWGAWSEWTQWADVDAFVRDVYCYDLNGIDASFDSSLYKAREFQAELRCKTSTTHGKTIASTLKALYDPSATFVSDGATVDGFKVNVTSDYAPAYFTVTSMMLDGAELLSAPVDFTMLGQTETIVIPWEKLSSLGALPSAGAQVTAKYYRGSDLYPRFVNPKTATFTISYGRETSTDPTFSEAPGCILEVTHPEGVDGSWVSYGGEVFGNMGSSIAYPFAEGARLLIIFGDGTVYNGDVPATTAKGGHAWSWDGGSFMLDVVDGLMTTSRAVKANSETFQLNNRAWESVKFSETLTGDFSAEGALKDGLTDSTKADLMELMRAHHAIYRAPTGEMAHVAVTSAQYTTTNGITRVNIGMVQETI